MHAAAGERHRRRGRRKCNCCLKLFSPSLTTCPLGSAPIYRAAGRAVSQMARDIREPRLLLSPVSVGPRSGSFLAIGASADVWGLITRSRRNSPLILPSECNKSCRASPFREIPTAQPVGLTPDAILASTVHATAMTPRFANAARGIVSWLPGRSTGQGFEHGCPRS